MSKSTHNSKKDLGVPGPKKARSGSGSKSSAKKRPGFPPTPSRAPAQATNNELMKCLSADHDRIERRVEDICKYLLAEHERQGEHRGLSKIHHEDIVAQIEANRKHLIRIESRLPAPAEEKSEPFKVGDLVVLLPIKEGGKALASGVLIKGHQTPLKVTNAGTYSGGPYYNLDLPGKCDFPPDRLRTATPEEITTYKEERARLQAEREAAEAAKPLEPGMRVQHNDGIRFGVYVAAKGSTSPCHWIASFRNESIPDSWVMKLWKRSEFTVLTSPTNDQQDQGLR